MPKSPFIPSEFTPTEWSTSAEKAEFGNSLLRFIAAGWKPTMFTKKLYRRLSMCFGNIAHYNLEGFYEEWFTTETDRLRFLEHLLRWPCYGQPAFTFCDVEQAIQEQIRLRGCVEFQRQLAANEIRTSELQILARLEQKYRDSSSEADCIPAAAQTSQATCPAPSSHLPMELPIQGSLF
jgi:hypothetical protein